MKAADDTWSLYYWAGDEIKPADTTLKFTGLGLTNNDSGQMMGIATDGKTYIIDISTINGDITLRPPTGLNQSYFHACRSEGTAIAGHSGCGGAKKTNYRLSVDTEGRAWVVSFDEGPDGVTTLLEGPTQVQGNNKMEYATVVGNGFNELFLARPRVQQPQTIINQMPTTGAPTGLASIGLLSTGIGLIGVMLMLMRRRV